MSYGNDKSIFDLSKCGTENSGCSLERIAPGWDTDTAADWKNQSLPTPGR
jgi:hypothetical protein